MKKVKELETIRSKSKQELLKELLGSQKKLTELKFSQSFLKLKNFHEITVTRKKIARLWTILSEKTIAELEDKENQPIKKETNES